MFGGNSIWACWLLILSYACVSSNLSAKSFEGNSQFALKSLIEFQQQNRLYKPLRIHTKVIEESFSNPEATKLIQSAFAASAKIISDLLLTKPLEGKLSLAANNQCSDILFNQISQIQNYEADIAIFAISNKEKGGIFTSKICEESGNKYIKSIALEVNSEKLIELDELSQAKELCIAIANALYKGRDEERKVLLSEIFEVLAKGREIKIVKFLGACRIGMAGCSACNNEDGTCTDCEEGFSLNDGVCSLTCTPPCEKCSENPTFCTACYDPNHMSNNAGTCKCTDPNAFFNTASNTCWCNQDFVNYQGTCTACTPPCVTCTYSPTMCTSCYNANRMILIQGSCECADTNAYFNTQTLLCTCKPGYFLVDGVYCSQCVSPCKTCSQNSATICETCYDGYFLNGSTCSRCESPCTLCTASSCNQCLVGYYLSENTCYLCQEPCLWCTNSATSCTACIVGNYLNGDKCFPCQIPCETCSGSATKCTDCYDSSNMSLNKGVCTCRSPNAYFDIKSLTCQCNSGYYSKEGLCMPCVSPCNVCTWTNICQGCIDGYWLNKQNCQACSPPCSKCNTSATQCTACITGTALNPTQALVPA